ncbi:hypothetical protein DFS33DRAFT_1297230 [Desarmillaria ectypa]|nr:hypothetical protein DFS33DRAFT_1297230 [Desarmillaria ectypa]
MGVLTRFFSAMMVYFLNLAASICQAAPSANKTYRILLTAPTVQRALHYGQHTCFLLARILLELRDLINLRQVSDAS